MSDKLKTYYEQEVERIMENLPLRKYHYVKVRQSKAFMEKYDSEKINLEKMAAAFTI